MLALWQSSRGACSRLREPLWCKRSRLPLVFSQERKPASKSGRGLACLVGHERLMIKTPGVTNTTEAVPPSLGQPGAPWLVIVLMPPLSSEPRASTGLRHQASLLWGGLAPEQVQEKEAPKKPCCEPPAIWFSGLAFQLPGGGVLGSSGPRGVTLAP